MSKLSLRQKLSTLRLESDLIDGDSFFFTDQELGREPIKWLKYLVMNKVGLEPITKIESQIHRYDFSNITDVVEIIKESYKHERSNQRMTVVKVVPWNRGAQLKNYRIFSYEDIDPTFQKISDDFTSCDHEIWLCESSVSDEGFNLGGRLTFPLMGKKIFLELVWFASPRMIESFSQSGFKYPYLQATRTNTWSHFNTELVYIPQFGKFQGLDEQLLLDDFEMVSRYITVKRDTIDVLVKALRKFGAKEVSFCFKVVDGDLTIIDWDTEIESTN